MKKYIIFSLVIIFIFMIMFSCNDRINGKSREIKVDEYRVVGEIADDTTYNGNIKFFNINSSKLAEEVEYTNGIMNGKRTLFYENGKPLSVLFYEMGRNVGYNTFFDSSGNLMNKTFWYYNLRVGPSIDYLNGDPVQYHFYTFENELIYSLNYEDLKSKKIVELNDNFFRLVKYDSTDYWQGNQRTPGIEYKIYLLNPPKFSFNYDIVVIDSLYQVVNVVKELDRSLPFSFFSINKATTSKYINAVRLRVVDSLNSKNDYVMYKKL